MNLRKPNGGFKKQRDSPLGGAKLQNGSKDPSESSLDNSDLGSFLLKQARALYSEAIPVLKCSIEIPVIDEGQDQALAKFAGSMQLGDTYAMDLWWVILRTRYCVTKMV
ncbi:hypothetical protein LguiB_007791 [Lonicera macranthoides]